MDIPRFANFLLLLGLAFCLAAGAFIAAWQLHPPHRTPEAHQMRMAVAQGRGSPEDRQALDALYLEAKTVPRTALWFGGVGALVGLLGFGLRLAAQPRAQG